VAGRGVQERGEETQERSEHFDKVIVHLKKSHEIKIRVLGHDHLQVAISYTNIGSIYADQGDPENALFHCQKAHEVFSAVNAYEITMEEYNALRADQPAGPAIANAKTPKNQAVETSRNFLLMGCMYRDQGKVAEAKAMLTCAYSILQKALGSSHPFTQVVVEQGAGILIVEDPGSGLSGGGASDNI